MAWNAQRGWWNAGVRRPFDGVVAVAAVDPLARDVDAMIERDWLRDWLVLVRGVRRTDPGHESDRNANERARSSDEAGARDRVRPAGKECRHMSCSLRAADGHGEIRPLPSARVGPIDGELHLRARWEQIGGQVHDPHADHRVDAGHIVARPPVVATPTNDRASGGLDARLLQTRMLFAELGERRPLVHGDMIRCVALDLVLWFISTRVHCVALEPDGRCHDARDSTADATCLRIPGDVVSAL